MFAVIKTGGKQYRVAAEEKITVMSLGWKPRRHRHVRRRSAVRQNGAARLARRSSRAQVTGEIVEQARGAKVIAFKKRRRQNSKRKRGHRQDLTIVRIVESGRLIAEGCLESRGRTLESD